MRDVTVIGWGRPGEKRISFIKLIRSELEIGLADAKARFESLLDTGKPVVIPAATPRSFVLAREVWGFGGEVRVLSGHANPSVQGLAANDELSDIQDQLDDIHERVARRDWMHAIESVRPDLAIGPEQIHEPLRGYALARASCSAIAGYELRSQPATDWTGELPLPAPLVEYYEEFGPMDLCLKAYGNPYFLPAFGNLWAHQRGYRWTVSRSGSSLEASRNEDWDDDWLVVGDEGGDPFILSRSTGRVLRADHGCGAWAPHEMFESLEQMAAALTAIGSVCASAGTDLTDDDSLIRPRWRAFLEADLDDALGSSAGADTLAALGFG